MRVQTPWLGLGLAALCAAALSLPTAALAAPCTLMAKAKGGVDLTVYFTKFAAEDKTGGRYKKCRIVTKGTEGTKTFRITPFRQDANVVVLKGNWP